MMDAAILKYQPVAVLHKSLLVSVCAWGVVCRLAKRTCHGSTLLGCEGAFERLLPILRWVTDAAFSIRRTTTAGMPCKSHQRRPARGSRARAREIRRARPRSGRGVIRNLRINRF
jgi:hypothetical protein